VAYRSTVARRSERHTAFLYTQGQKRDATNAVGVGRRVLLDDAPLRMVY